MQYLVRRDSRAVHGTPRLAPALRSGAPQRQRRHPQALPATMRRCFPGMDSRGFPWRRPCARMPTGDCNPVCLDGSARAARIGNHQRQQGRKEGRRCCPPHPRFVGRAPRMTAARSGAALRSIPALPQPVCVCRGLWPLWPKEAQRKLLPQLLKGHGAWACLRQRLQWWRLVPRSRPQ